VKWWHNRNIATLRFIAHATPRARTSFTTTHNSTFMKMPIKFRDGFLCPRAWRPRRWLRCINEGDNGNLKCSASKAKRKALIPSGCAIPKLRIIFFRIHPLLPDDHDGIVSVAPVHPPWPYHCSLSPCSSSICKISLNIIKGIGTQGCRANCTLARLPKNQNGFR
jgi:hypothetical protein